MTKLQIFGPFNTSFFTTSTLSRKQSGIARRCFASAACIFLCVVAGITASAQTYTDLYNFGNVSNGPDDTRSTGIIVQGHDGAMYSTSPQTWIGKDGDVFSITPAGVVRDVFTFDGSNGSVVSSGATLSLGGDFYAAANAGGSNRFGVTFKVTPAGVMTPLHDFTNGADGAEPSAPPIQGLDGAFYGNASSCAGLPPGNVCNINVTFGSIYQITPRGGFRVLHTFTGPDGINPFGLLVQHSNNWIYGTTAAGGAHGKGTIFQISTAGTFNSLYSFDGTHGAYPFVGLVLASDGNLYGNTTEGGSNGDGVIFRITPSGRFSVVYNLTDDAFDPVGGMVQATDGNLYGTTNFGGASGAGAIFQITLDGTFNIVASFGGGNGSTPQSAIMQHTNGLLYGDTAVGGSADRGVFYSLNMGLAPFVTFLPAARNVGQTVEILGQGFTSATGVAFNGTAASFTAESDTYLTAVVPPGATTGRITVTESSATLTSNKIFRVLPQIFSLTPTSGAAGTTVVISGDSFTGATYVAFACGKKASFTVDSDTQITAIVPADAITGKIQVMTAGGSLRSPTIFTITP